MRSPRETCEKRHICGATGHVRVRGVWTRCDCLQLEINQRALGAMYTPHPKEDTPLEVLQDTNLVLQGPLEKVRQHVARVLLNRAAAAKPWVTIDAYRLLEIFLEKDAEFTTQTAVTEAELLVFLLGFGDPRNSYLPELVLQALTRRELTNLPTWVILGIPLANLATKYSSQVFEKISAMKPVSVR